MLGPIIRGPDAKRVHVEPALQRVEQANAAGAIERWENVPGFWSTVGDRTLKYAAWGDGYDDAHLVDGGDGAFTVWYERGGAVVGVLTHEVDDDYERGRELVERGAAR